MDDTDGSSSQRRTGNVKWFSNRKGYGFISPCDGNSGVNNGDGDGDGDGDDSPVPEDIFVHQSSIVTESEYRTLRKGAQVEFQTMMDDSGKLKATDVTYPGGAPCPAPNFSSRRARGKSVGRNEEQNDDDQNKNNKGDHEAKLATGDENWTKRNRNRSGRRRKKAENSADATEDDDKYADSTPTQEQKAEAKPNEDKNQPRSKPDWFTSMDEAVQKSIEQRRISVGPGRTFFKMADSRFKLGSGGYATMGHSTGLLAEGLYEVLNDGTVSFTWEHVAVVDTSGENPEWKEASDVSRLDFLVPSLSLADDSVQPTDMYEEITALWGEDKGDPTPALGSIGFLMKKISLSPNACDKARRGFGNRRGRYRNRGQRSNNKSNAGRGETNAPTPYRDKGRKEIIFFILFIGPTKFDSSSIAMNRGGTIMDLTEEIQKKYSDRITLQSKELIKIFGPLTDASENSSHDFELDFHADVPITQRGSFLLIEAPYPFETLFRSDWLSAAPGSPRSYQVLGAVLDPFEDQGFVQNEVLNDAIAYLKRPITTSNRVAYAALVAPSGFGKSVSLAMISDLIYECFESVNSPSLIDVETHDKIAATVKNYVAGMLPTDREDIAKYMPICITFNSGMDYSNADEKDMNIALASRFAYSYFADPNHSFGAWKNLFDKHPIDMVVLFKFILKMAQEIGREKLLLVIDEPDIRRTGVEVAKAIKSTALLTNVFGHAAAIFSGLDPRWLRATGDTMAGSTTTSGHPIQVISAYGIPEDVVLGTVLGFVQLKNWYDASDRDKMEYETACYMLALASGRWRTLRDLLLLLKLDKCDSFEYLFKNYHGNNSAETSEHAPEILLPILAHSVINSHLQWMEPLPNGSIAWETISIGFVRDSFRSPVLLAAPDLNQNEYLVPRVAFDTLGSMLGVVGTGSAHARMANEAGPELIHLLSLFFYLGRFAGQKDITPTEDSYKFELVTGLVFCLKWWAYSHLRSEGIALCLIAANEDDIPNQAWFENDQGASRRAAEAASYVSTLKYISDKYNNKDLHLSFRSAATDAIKAASTGSSGADYQNHINKLITEMDQATQRIGATSEEKVQLIDRYSGFGQPPREELAKRATIFRNIEWISEKKSSIFINQPLFKGVESPSPRLLQLLEDEYFVQPNQARKKTSPPSFVYDFLLGFEQGKPKKIKWPDGILPNGSVLMPGAKSNNPAFDTLVLLKKSDGGHSLVLIEDKRTRDLSKDMIRKKLEILTRCYRGILFVNGSQDNSTSVPDRAKELGLPLIYEKNIVVVFVTTPTTKIKDFPDATIITKITEAQVVLANTKSLFGPTLSLLPVPGRYSRSQGK